MERCLPWVPEPVLPIVTGPQSDNAPLHSCLVLDSGHPFSHVPTFAKWATGTTPRTQPPCGMYVCACTGADAKWRAIMQNVEIQPEILQATDKEHLLDDLGACNHRCVTYLGTHNLRHHCLCL